MTTRIVLGLVFCISEAGRLTAEVARGDRLAGGVDRGQDGSGCHLACLEDDGATFVTLLGLVANFRQVDLPDADPEGVRVLPCVLVFINPRFRDLDTGRPGIDGVEGELLQVSQTSLPSQSCGWHLSTQHL
ncbi:hypothetical protein ABT150_16170 [Streptomyces mirabilis]|uniref:hypothetical protein n=1 Tax=Streptomyces mirabilis TaxID=68239 RepID=UPI00332B088E